VGWHALTIGETRVANEAKWDWDIVQLVVRPQLKTKGLAAKTGKAGLGNVRLAAESVDF
jgi:hypothetical protein